MNLTRKEICLVYESFYGTLEACGFEFKYEDEPPEVVGVKNKFGDTFEAGCRLADMRDLMHKLWTKVGPEKLGDWRWTEVTEEHRISAVETSEGFYEDVACLITREKAEKIRKLRVDDNLSWRSVAEETDWGLGWGSNQLAGMALCKVAAKYFGEDMYDKVWNNANP